MKILRGIHLGKRQLVVAVMLIFAWAITFGPNSTPVAGALLLAQQTLGVYPAAFAIASIVGAIYILAFNPGEAMFLVAVAPVSAYYAIVIAHSLQIGFSLGTIAFTTLAYFYIIEAAKG